MPLNGLDLLLWAFGLLGHALLLGVLVIRRRAKEFPAFTAFIAANVLRTLLLATIRQSGSERAYFLAYVVTQVLDVMLQFAVVYEVASHVFRPLGRWAPDIRRGIWLISVGSLAVAGALSWLGTSVQANWRATLFIRLSFFSSTLMSELFVGMVFLSVTVGLPWRTHVARIAHGLGAYSLVDVAIEAAHTLHGSAYRNRVDATWTYFRMAVYLLCLLYWIVTLWRRAPEPRELPAEVRKHLRDLQGKLAYDLYTLRSWKKP